MIQRQILRASKSSLKYIQQQQQNRPSLLLQALSTASSTNCSSRRDSKSSRTSSISSRTISTTNLQAQNQIQYQDQIQTQTQTQIQNRQTKIQIIGDSNQYDAVKQLRLIQIPDEFNPQPNLLASMHVKRNIIFGTRIHDIDFAISKGKGKNNGVVDVDVNVDDNGPAYSYSYTEDWGFVKVCKPLLKRCLDEAGKEGDQPQGLAALDGLSSRVKYLIDASDNTPSTSTSTSSESKVIETLRQELHHDNHGNNDSNKIAWEAIQAVATQIPRPGHDTVGLGTYIDARDGWSQLAKEYALTRKGNMVIQGEAQLFHSFGAVVVGIEYIGDEENDNYWIDSGGAMARFFFV
jgi:hypothetical protein